MCAYLRKMTRHKENIGAGGVLFGSVDKGGTASGVLSVSRRYVPATARGEARLRRLAQLREELPN